MSLVAGQIGGVDTVAVAHRAVGRGGVGPLAVAAGTNHGQPAIAVIERNRTAGLRSAGKAHLAVGQGAATERRDRRGGVEGESKRRHARGTRGVGLAGDDRVAAVSQAGRVVGPGAGGIGRGGGGDGAAVDGEMDHGVGIGGTGEGGVGGDLVARRGAGVAHQRGGQDGRRHDGNERTSACHDNGGSSHDIAAAGNGQGAATLHIGQHGRVRAGAVILVAVAGQDDLTARQVAAHAGHLHAVGGKRIVNESGGTLDHGAGTLVVLEAALLHQGDAGGGVDAWSVVFHEIGALDGHVMRAVVEDQARAPVLAKAAAGPLEIAGDSAADAVGEARAALGVAVHPGIEHVALDVADDVEADAADMLDVDVADLEIVDCAVGSIGDDLDAVALGAAALDEEVRQRQRADVDAGADHDLDDRAATGDLRDQLGAAKVKADRSLARLGEIDDDRCGNGVGAPRQMSNGSVRDRGLQRAFHRAGAGAVGYGSGRRGGHARQRRQGDAM